MSHSLTVVLFFVLDSVLLVASSVAVDCTLPTKPSANSCPVVVGGNCLALVEWFQQNETACKGKKHAAIKLSDGNMLKVVGTASFTVDFSKFKQYDMSTGRCDDNKIIVQNPDPAAFTDPQAAMPATEHDLTAVAREGPACYGVYFKLQDGTIVDPHIIISGTGVAAHAKSQEKKKY